MINNPKLLPIHIYGDKVLRQRAKEVEQLTDDIKLFINDLTHTMYIRDGVGLAAPQVGVSLRIFVIDTEWFKTDEKNPKVFINPQIIDMEDEEINEEGCLSLPNIFENVKRYKSIKIKALNENWEEVEYYAQGFLSVAIQHEFDHLNGVLFVDKIQQIRKLIIKRL